jgi:hypothetical protein
MQVIEPTVIAALNMYYPGNRLSVHVLDDGRKPEVQAMVERLKAQCRWAAGGVGAAAAAAVLLQCCCSVAAMLLLHWLPCADTWTKCIRYLWCASCGSGPGA